MKYEDFLAAFEDGRKSAYGARRPPVARIDQDADLSNMAAEAKLREKISANKDVLTKVVPLLLLQKRVYPISAIHGYAFGGYCLMEL